MTQESRRRSSCCFEGRQKWPFLRLSGSSRRYYCLFWHQCWVGGGRYDFLASSDFLEGLLELFCGNSFVHLHHGAIQSTGLSQDDDSGGAPGVPSNSGARKGESIAAHDTDHGLGSLCRTGMVGSLVVVVLECHRKTDAVVGLEIGSSCVGRALITTESCICTVGTLIGLIPVGLDRCSPCNETKERETTKAGEQNRFRCCWWNGRRRVGLGTSRRCSGHRCRWSCDTANFQKS